MDLAVGAHAWMHLGANIGGHGPDGLWIQNSDTELREIVAGELIAVGIDIERESPPGTRPSGAVYNIFDSGGRYTSIIGSTEFFHRSMDHWPYATNMYNIAKLAHVYLNVA